MKKRKGSSQDLLAGVKFIGSIIVSVLLGGTFYFQFTSHLYDVPIIASEAKMIFGILDKAILAFDWLAPFLMIGLIIGSLYLAHLIPANPMYLPFSLILGLFSIYMSAQLSNLWIAMAKAPLIAQTVGKFVNTKALMLNIPIIITAWWILLMGVMYKTGKSGGGANPIR